MNDTYSDLLGKPNMLPISQSHSCKEHLQGVKLTKSNLMTTYYEVFAGMTHRCNEGADINTRLRGQRSRGEGGPPQYLLWGI